ncbi:hypothetical protein ACFLRN_01680 [Thermoproteota archaeon]
MTLIIYLRCNDGCILVSDRQASSPGGYNRQEKKLFLSENKNLVIAGAGDGFEVSRICSLICDTENNDTNVRAKFNEAVDEFRTRYAPAVSDVDTIVVVREEDRIVAYNINIIGTQIIDSRITAEFRTCGRPAAKIIADYFLMKKKIDELDWITATHYAIAVMQEVANNVDGVGKIENFGFDISVILNNGEIYEKENFREISAWIHTDFKIPEDAPNFIETTQEAGN